MTQSPTSVTGVRLSVIIPTLQEEKLIVQTLSQFTPALREKYNIEIIVSDGGSTDRTVKLASTLADDVVTHQHSFKQNISMGRNRGADHATGEIYFFLSADVLIEDPERFFSVMTSVIGNSGIAAATCKVVIPPDQRKFKDTLYHSFFNWYFRILNVLGMGMGRGECHVMRADVFRSVGGYNESIAAGEDYELFMRLRRTGKISFVRDLTIFESPRRYRRFGYMRITFLWMLNGLGVLFFRRAMVREWTPVR